MRIPRQPIVPAFKLANTTTTATTGGAVTPGHNQKGNNSLVVEIPKEATYDLPEGRYGARISDLRPFIKQAGHGPQDWIRIHFDVQVPHLSETMDARAARNFKMDFSPGSEFRNWLTGLLGREFFQQHSGQQVDLEFLIGTECEVELEHYWGKGHPKPHVNVARVHPVTSKKPATDKVVGGKD